MLNIFNATTETRWVNKSTKRQQTPGWLHECLLLPICFVPVMHQRQQKMSNEKKDVCQPVWSLSPEKWAAHKHSKSGEDSLLLQQLLSVTLQILSLRANVSRRLRRCEQTLAVVCRCAQTWAHVRRREQTCADVSTDLCRCVQMWADANRCEKTCADVSRRVSRRHVSRCVQMCADVCRQCRLAGETYWVRTGTLSPALRTCWRPWTLQATWAGGGLVVEGPGRLWVQVVPTFEMRCSDWTL